MPNSAEDKKKVLARIRRIGGQVEALERALGSDVPCVAMLQQIAAIRGAANGLMAEMMEIHLKDTLLAGEPSLNERTQCTDEISGFIRSYLK
ncbi:metal/formaldehyde-sensitive transcriptional repressor [Rouxiella badensis]|jgi:DNA-binding FrmR family transcriptional regulator|uniref:Metal/formaldehyde-sensitive transcriptional repressor n=1 Tax=Rouxiella badensis TaxID=1646377 RepID=A0A1X0WHW2_9GAMM|nr:metal/formaldehyde-sensitive transcriptional repressor [Rouxiella badensis]MCC3703438.1 metal/formaldehyde-sensitive transcriptional repressor [Rouxiella badensis]MCC3718377.1 metal/formaldehyde-sensitive transcriptional repressor [Rouxiella badensis]MCC3726855.1 metal/formaldehyde-sensitive transcriptional repressor [Rouxiella badensis]MCC3731861.1 metal/formaldehyde-sensitive transcriptional repressor [Rouxiella badensis]MCC3738796.1 metal/formaldehyde-sensitive transcriptional repressor 